MKMDAENKSRMNRKQKKITRLNPNSLIIFFKHPTNHIFLKRQRGLHAIITIKYTGKDIWFNSKTKKVMAMLILDWKDFRRNEMARERAGHYIMMNILVLWDKKRLRNQITDLQNGLTQSEWTWMDVKRIKIDIEFESFSIPLGNWKTMRK